MTKQFDDKRIKEVIELTSKIYDDVLEVYKKYFKINPHVTTMILLGSPISMLFTFLKVMDPVAKMTGLSLCDEFDVPGVLMRMAKPMESIGHLWGKVDIQEFTRLYSEEFARIQKESFSETDFRDYIIKNFQSNDIEFH